MSERYGMSTYPDVDKINAKIAALMEKPIIPLKKEAMKKYLDYYATKCTKSKAMIEKAKEFIPGGVQHNLAFNYPHPIVITKAEGAYLYDLDGNKYIDFLQSGGATMLGSNYPLVKEKAIEVINDAAPSTGLFHEYEYKLAKIINKYMPNLEMFRALGSGTEAVMASIRIARVATKKKNVIKMGGAYHGWSDQVTYGMHIPGTGRMESHGIPKSVHKYMQEVYPNDINALKKALFINRFRGGTAAIIVEPLGPESGTRPVYKELMGQIRELCDQYGALLIFDEVVTGFRLGMGGAQGYFNVKPDLTVLGKVIAGGYPSAGGVGGSKELMEYVAAGVGSGKKRAYVGGTLAANPLSSVAGYYAIKEIARTNACVKAGKYGDRMNKGLEEIIDKYELPYVIYNHGSIVHLETVAPMQMKIYVGLNLYQTYKTLKSKPEIYARKHAMEEMGSAFMAEGIITIAGSRIYTSLATDEAVVDEALIGFDKVFSQVEGAKL